MRGGILGVLSGAKKWCLSICCVLGMKFLFTSGISLSYVKKVEVRFSPTIIVCTPISLFSTREHNCLSLKNKITPWKVPASDTHTAKGPVVECNTLVCRPRPTLVGVYVAQKATVRIKSGKVFVQKKMFTSIFQAQGFKRNA